MSIDGRAGEEAGRGRRQNALFDALPVGGAICALQIDAHGRVTAASAGCGALFRREAARLLGATTSELFFGFELPNEPTGSRDLRVAREGRPGHVRLFWTRRARGASLLIADLEQLSTGGLAEEAAAAQLASEVVHEVRNPLASVKMVVQTLSRGPEDPKVARRLTIALREVRAIERIVSALAGRVRFAAALESHRLDAVIEQSLSELRLELSERGLGLQVLAAEPLPTVLCDPARLKLALGQLVGVLSHALESGEVVVESRTDGPGVELCLKALPSPSWRPSGAGISLALVHAVAKEHGGELREVEGGFVLELPVESSRCL